MPGSATSIPFSEALLWCLGGEEGKGGARKGEARQETRSRRQVTPGGTDASLNERWNWSRGQTDTGNI